MPAAAGDVQEGRKLSTIDSAAAGARGSGAGLAAACGGAAGRWPAPAAARRVAGIAGIVLATVVAWTGVPGATAAAAETAEAAAAGAAAQRFVVVEQGRPSLLVVDLGAAVQVRRVALPAALRGAPAFTRDGAHAYLAGEGGWVGRIDLRSLTLDAQTRLGSAVADLELSSDGRVVAVAPAQAGTLALLDAELRPLRTLTIADTDGRPATGITALHDAPQRRSFVALLAGVAELWEISYDPTADDVAIGKIHDFQYREGAFVPGYLNPRRTRLQAPLAAVQFSPDRSELLGWSGGGAAQAQLVNLDVRKRFAGLALEGGVPQLRCAAAWTVDGRARLALPGAALPGLTLLDTRSWQLLARVPTAGPGRFAVSHPALAHAWVAVEADSGQQLLRIDKRSLQVQGTPVTPPGGAITQLELDAGGAVALAPLRDADAVAVVDALTLAERAHFAAQRPLAVYQVLRRAADRGGQCP